MSCARPGATFFALVLCTMAFLPDAAVASPSGDGAELQKLVPVDGAVLDRFGRALSLRGEVLAVASTHDDDLGSSSGSVFVYRHDGSQWQLEQKLLAPDGAAGDHFGWSVSVHGDRILAGAYLDDVGGVDQGSAHVFRHDGQQWVHEAQLVAADGAAGDGFGISVGLSGGVAVVGAWQHDLGGQDGTGAAYVFQLGAQGWQQAAKLSPSDARAGANFGWAASAEGEHVAIGAWRADANSGTAYVFARDAQQQWSEQARLKASDAAVNDYFGDALSLSGDALLIGSKGDDAHGRYTGAAYVFRRSGSSWIEEARLSASDPFENDRFGASLSLSGDTALIGAWRDDDAGHECGAAYVYRFDGTAWGDERKLRSSDLDAGDHFGWGVSIDGELAAVSSYGDDGAVGSAYLFDVAPGPLDFSPFGDGLAGSGGITPRLEATACGWAAELSIRDGLGDARGTFWAGLGHTFDNPFHGGEFYIDFSLPFFFFPIRLGGAPGVAGAGQLDLDVADLSAFDGLDLSLQVKLHDPMADFGQSLSNGLQLRIGD